MPTASFNNRATTLPSTKVIEYYRHAIVQIPHDGM